MKLAFTYLGSELGAWRLFDCGEPDLNAFVRDDAARFVKLGLSAVKLLVDADSKRLVGFYAISPLSLNVGKLSQEQRKLYNVDFPIPAWLIGRLAVDRQWQGSHLGSALLLDAINNIRCRANKGAGALIIVDAKNRKVKKFYKKYGFSTLPSSGLRLAYSIAEHGN